MLRFGLIFVSQNCRNMVTPTMLMKSVQGVASVKASFPYPPIGKSLGRSATSRQVSRSCIVCFSEYTLIKNLKKNKIEIKVKKLNYSNVY